MHPSSQIDTYFTRWFKQFQWRNTFNKTHFSLKFQGKHVFNTNPFLSFSPKHILVTFVILTRPCLLQITGYFNVNVAVCNKFKKLEIVPVNIGAFCMQNSLFQCLNSLLLVKDARNIYSLQKTQLEFPESRWKRSTTDITCFHTKKSMKTLRDCLIREC